MITNVDSSLPPRCIDGPHALLHSLCTLYAPLMAALQALVATAGGAAQFNTHAQQALAHPYNPAAHQPVLFDNIAEWNAISEAGSNEFTQFLRAPSDDASAIAPTLNLRPYGMTPHRTAEGARIYWRRLNGGGVDYCLLGALLADGIHQEWMARFRVFYRSIHGLPTGPPQLTVNAYLLLQQQQQEAEHAHFAADRAVYAEIAKYGGG